MSNTSCGIADHNNSGELLHLVANGLTANAFDVRLPTREHGSRLTIRHMDARGTLSVSDSGYIEWECPPPAGDRPDPKLTADLATTLLTGRIEDTPYGGNAYADRGITFKGIVGLELQSRGLDVHLEIHEDKEYFDAQAVIVVTHPDTEDAAKVIVTDDGYVTWTSEFSGWISAPTKVADAVVETITQAVSGLRHPR